MTSFIIVSKNSNASEAYATDFCQKREITPFDITFLDRAIVSDDAKAQKQSIGIEDVKKMQQKIFLKPVQSPEKAIIVRESHVLTIPAQNALLKVLEEPPEHTLFFLLTESLTNLLPTIQSRCQIISIESEKEDTSPDSEKEVEDIARALDSLSIGQALTLAEQYGKSKDEALTFLELLLHTGRKNLLSDSTRSEDSLFWKFVIQETQDTYMKIKTTNAHVRLLLEHFFFTLSKTKKN